MTHTPHPLSSNLEDSALIRNVLKSQRRERGDHTVLMNRDGEISSNLHLHLISPSAHKPSPIFLSAFVSSSSEFPCKLCFPFFLPSFCLTAHAILCLFSPTNSMMIFSFSVSPSALPPPNLSISIASTPLSSCVLVGVVVGLALCSSRSVSTALALPSAHPAPWSLINQSPLVFVYRPVVC